MENRMIKIAATLTLTAASVAQAVAAPSVCAVAVTQEPVVLRISKDEFRIAFAVSGDQCRENGCSGVIRYQAAWRTEHGPTTVDRKVLSYNIPDGANRSIAVDRHYFDTAEAQHTTNIVRINVDEVSCVRPTERVAVK